MKEKNNLLTAPIVCTLTIRKQGKTKYCVYAEDNYFKEPMFEFCKKGLKTHELAQKYIDKLFITVKDVRFVQD